MRNRSIEPIKQICADVAANLEPHQYDITGIRTALNDRIDEVEKSGMRVMPHSQDAAVKRVIGSLYHVFEDVGGWYYSPRHLGYLDTRGVARKTKREARTASIEAFHDQ
jgi:hypothetical protein